MSELPSQTMLDPEKYLRVNLYPYRDRFALKMKTVTALIATQMEENFISIALYQEISSSRIEKNDISPVVRLEWRPYSAAMDTAVDDFIIANQPDFDLILGSESWATAQTLIKRDRDAYELNLAYCLRPCPAPSSGATADRNVDKHETEARPPDFHPGLIDEQPRRRESQQKRRRRKKRRRRGDCKQRKGKRTDSKVAALWKWFRKITLRDV